MSKDSVSHPTSRRKLLQTSMAAASLLGLGIGTAHAAKASKGSVGYQDAPNGNKNCSNCKLFMSPNGCKSVEGEISPNGWCKIWRG
jgi:hypothetical protein